MKPRELRSKSVGTKVTAAELRVLESRAERAGLTMSEWVRDVLLGSSVEMGTLATVNPLVKAQGLIAFLGGKSTEIPRVTLCDSPTAPSL